MGQSISSLLEKFKSGYSGRAIYLYDLDVLAARIDSVKKQFGSAYKIHFAMKCNHFPAVLKVIRESGFGVDVVSGGEFQWATECGFAASEIVFSGIGKTKAELEMAIRQDVKQINVESEAELERIIMIAKRLGKTVNLALRVNPDVEADTHPYIRTGLKENKFGVDFETCEQLLARIADEPCLKFQGCSLHIGSQIRESSPFKEAIQKTLALYDRWQAKLPLMKTVDIGGGLGMNYQSGDIQEDLTLLENYAATVRSVLEPWLNSGKLSQVILEPGRLLVARAGTLYAQVEYVKRNSDKNFLILNTGMHHLMRPMLYQAFHRIECVGRDYVEAVEMYDVVGPICESTDTLGRERLLPSDVKEGDWVAIRDVGAYGSVMMNDYNLQLKAVELAARDGQIFGDKNL